MDTFRQQLRLGIFPSPFVLHVIQPSNGDPYSTSLLLQPLFLVQEITFEPHLRVWQTVDHKWISYQFLPISKQ
jgi:hypothetical protein